MMGRGGEGGEETSNQMLCIQSQTKLNGGHMFTQDSREYSTKTNKQRARYQGTSTRLTNKHFTWIKISFNLPSLGAKF